MLKQDLIDSVAAGADITKTAAERALNALASTIQQALAMGDEVNLIGVGTFRAEQRAERQGRNPKTGEIVAIPAKVAPKFSAAKALKDALKHAQ